MQKIKEYQVQEKFTDGAAHGITDQIKAELAGEEAINKEVFDADMVLVDKIGGG